MLNWSESLEMLKSNKCIVLQGQFSQNRISLKRKKYYLFSPSFVNFTTSFHVTFVANQQALNIVSSPLQVTIKTNSESETKSILYDKMLSNIGVGVSKFLGVRRIFAEFPQTCPKSFCATIAYKFSPQRSWRPFLVWPPQKGFMCFSANVGRRFSKSNNVWRHFCPDFQGFCSDFQGFCPDI